MVRQGYYLQPTLHRDTIVFASEQDLWSVPASGGLARRLTVTSGAAGRPVFSPDGTRLAYVGVEEGAPEVYVMPAEGGEAKRLTRLAAPTLVLGWSRDGSNVLYGTLRGQKNHRHYFVYAIPADGGIAEVVPVGPAVSLAHGPGGAVVIGRGSGLDPAWWKRYRGGRIGELWIDRDGSGEFQKLIETGGNLANPMWIKGRIHFLSDHEGIGNLYSCNPDGAGLKRHTDHEEFYCRMASSDGVNIVFMAGGDLYLLDPDSDQQTKVEVDFPSPRPKRARRFVAAQRFLEDVDIHPEGHSLCLTARGKPFTMAHWEGAVKQYGVPGGSVRYRLSRWLNDGKRIVCVSDEGREEALEVFGEDGKREKRLDAIDVGRPVSLGVSPVRDEVVLTNHRGELIWIDLEKESWKTLETSRHGRIRGFDFSPDGNWIAYGMPMSQKAGAIFLADLSTGEKHQATEPVLRDVNPCFDPDGKFLYYVSFSGFDPVRDILDFSYGFPRGIQLKLVTLRKDQISPFVPQPKPVVAGPPTGAGAPDKKPEKPEETEADKGDGERKADGPEPLEIDLDGLATRIVTFPIQVGIYGNLTALPGGKVLYLSSPIEGLKGKGWMSGDSEPKSALMLFDAEKGKEEPLIQGVSDYTLCGKRKTLAYRCGPKLRVIPAGAKPPEEPPEPPNRKNGFIDLNRIRISVNPVEEWRQMFAEAWRLLREHYYSEDMAGVDWEKVYQRYSPLIDRASSRRDLSDLFWEMGGELGTSHAYELGGDYPPIPRYPQGFLGADFAFRDGTWVFDHIVCGDPGEEKFDSPLNAPGINVSEGDALLAINGMPVGPGTPPEELLVNQGGQMVELIVARGDETRTVTVKALNEDMPVRHREWVRRNLERVHHETDGRVGYLHISDMSPQGFSEFHQAFLREVERDALIIDVRYNMGGHVSPLLLERLQRRRTGFGVARWLEAYPRPTDAYDGPLVCLTDEFSGSDGDVFSHNFKQLGLGPLIGKRTWGGIVGLAPSHPLVDGTVTTQPEFFNWFEDVGFGLENRGAEPDIVVEIAPQDFANDRDPQMEKALEVVGDLLEKNPPTRPDFGPRPDRTLPKLPPRG